MALPFIPLPFGVKIEVSWTTGGGIAVCVHFVTKNSAIAISPSDLSNVVDAADTWRLGIRGTQSSVWRAAGIRATDWSSSTGGTYFNGALATPDGLLSSAVEPNNVAVVASLRTAKRGRSYRGRNYIGGLNEGNIGIGDIIGNGTILAIAQAYADFHTALNSAGFTHVVASFFNNGAARVTGQGNAVTSVFVDPYSDSQRRRLAGRGA